MKKNKLFATVLFLFTISLFSQSPVGVYWNGTNEVFASMDITSGEFTDISVLPDVQWINGPSTFNETNNWYAIITNLGITIIDASNGTIINTLPNSVSWTAMEFGINNNLLGVYWNGTNEIFASMDITSGVFTDISVLPGVQFIIIGSSTFDETNNRYIIETDLGISIIDASNGNVINTFPNSIDWIKMEFGNNNNLLGVYWNGTNEIFASMDITSGVFTDISVLSNDQFASNYSTFDIANNRYTIGTDFGITIIDASNGSIINTFPNSIGWTFMEYAKDISPGTINYSLQNFFNIYPNPINSIINISTNSESNISHIEIINHIGETVYSSKYPSLRQVSINSNRFASGLYFIKINQSFETLKVLKK